MNRGPLLNSSLPCPVCGVSHCNERRVTLTLLPCVFARKYRGELRSVATRRGIKKTSNGSNRGGLEYKQAPDNCGGASGFVPLAIEKNKQDRKYNHAIIPLSPYPTFAKKQTSDDRYKIRNDHRPER